MPSPVLRLGVTLTVSAQGGAWNDTMTGGGRRDILFGNEGSDKLEGGLGNDVPVGGTGSHMLTGGLGIDMVTCATSEVVVNLGAQAGDDARGDVPSNIENLRSSAFCDVLGAQIVGPLSNDLAGGAGYDVLSGDGGNDTIWGGAGSDLLAGGSGSESCFVTSGDVIVDFLGSDRVTADEDCTPAWPSKC